MTIITDKLLLLQNDFSNVIFFSARISPRNTPAEILHTRYCPIISLLLAHKLMSLYMQIYGLAFLQALWICFLGVFVPSLLQ